jgi:hypothetical protein
MNWFKRIVRRWLAEDLFSEVAGKGGPTSPLNLLSDQENPTLITVVPIDNGLLLMNRQYNPNGPDRVSAMYAADAESLATALVNRLAHQKLTAR